ncbi:MAG: hypothetical protein OHK0053_34740 [Microscillaceae bacterium]
MPLCNTSTSVELKSFNYADGTNYFGSEIDSYEITVPSGWTVNGQMGTVTTPIRTFTLGIPNSCSTGSIVVRGKQTCFSCPTNVSSPATFTVVRTPTSITVSPYTARCDETTATLSTQNFGCATTYQLVLPSGWAGPNGQSVFNGGSSVSVIPNGTTGGVVSVTSVLNCNVNITGAFTIPFDNSVDTPVFTLAPAIICNNGTQNFTVSVPQGNPRTFTWTVGSGLRLPNGTQTQTFTFGSNQTGHTVAITGQNSGNGFVNVSLTAANRCGGVSTASRNVFLGKPLQPSSLTGPSNPFAGNVYQL